MYPVIFSQRSISWVFVEKFTPTFVSSSKMYLQRKSEAVYTDSWQFTHDFFSYYKNILSDQLSAMATSQSMHFFKIHYFLKVRWVTNFQSKNWTGCKGDPWITDRLNWVQTTASFKPHSSNYSQLHTYWCLVICSNNFTQPVQESEATIFIYPLVTIIFLSFVWLLLAFPPCGYQVQI